MTKIAWVKWNDARTATGQVELHVANRLGAVILETAGVLLEGNAQVVRIAQDVLTFPEDGEQTVRDVSVILRVNIIEMRVFETEVGLKPVLDPAPRFDKVYGDGLAHMNVGESAPVGTPPGSSPEDGLADARKMGTMGIDWVRYGEVQENGNWRRLRENEATEGRWRIIYESVR